MKPSQNFKYLDELIHGDAEEIILDSDIALSGMEEYEYYEGIDLDVDDLTIDGNGHSIDACKKARIFNCTASGIKIKNITLKNGFNNESGGAILIEDGELTISDSTILNSSSGDDGGAIHNDEEN